MQLLLPRQPRLVHQKPPHKANKASPVRGAKYEAHGKMISSSVDALLSEVMRRGCWREVGLARAGVLHRQPARATCACTTVHQSISLLVQGLL